MDADTAHRIDDPTPEQFLTQVQSSNPGWSDQYGGPMGVATLCANLQEQLAHQSETIAAIRTAAIQELLKTHKGTELAATFGISRAAISNINRSNTWTEATW